MITELQSTAAAGLVYEPGLPAVELRRETKARTGHRSATIYFVVAVMAVVLGSGALLPLWIHMYGVWTHDPLRAIGAWFPLISLAGVLTKWHLLRWDLRGSTWGYVPIVLSILAAWFLFAANPRFAVNGVEFSLAPWGVVLFAYGAGACVLFGGSRLLRAALAPLCLLLFLNPVPHAYNALVDMPLQQFSAATARSFAHVIGLHPTGEQLRMMFAPNFGMMIVPGCNGVRGSITLAYLALIYGYTRRLRPARLTSVALLGFFAGYALNLIRLCLLVVYYRVGLTLPSIQPYGAGIDYVIGGTIFLFATLTLGLFIRRLEAKSSPAVAISPASMDTLAPDRLANVWRPCFLLMLAAAVVVPQLRGLSHAFAPRLTEETASRLFPAHVGEYQLVRTYGEQQSGSLVFALADYEQPAAPSHPPSDITLGFWLGGPDHLVALSRKAQGLRPEWIGSFDATTQTQPKIHLYSTYFDDGLSRQYNAETICSEAACSAGLPSAKGFHLEISNIGSLNILRGPGKHLPVLLRREWPETTAGDPADLRRGFELDARHFISKLDLRPILETAGSEF